MKLRSVNQKLLKLLIYQAGGYDEAALKTGKSRALLSRLANGKYNKILKETSRNEICEGLETTEDELFPLVSASDDQEAS